ncbi:GvpL/GvpF family gas vesicle protein [Actinocrispum sp. NPDC049592]|uniref:GvpL/GvpF family gas vesicle protein n=1 Tax=Actinocrispum sp. NPDC049592 TaxID=3154835 RepID=UPI0034389688
MTGRIQDLAAEHASHVLAQALPAAIAQATTELTALLAKAIVAEATRAQGETGLCAYAITRTHDWDPAAMPDLHAAAPPRLITRNGLGLVATDVSLSLFSGLEAKTSEDSPLATLAREHDAVVRAVFERAPVLPLRFGTIVAGEQAAHQLLDTRHNELLERLALVAGHREWGVRVRYEPPAEEPVEGLSGTDYLRMRQQTLAGGTEVTQAAKSLHTKLSQHASDVTCHDDTVLDAAYLVAVEQEDAFRTEAAALTAHLVDLGATVHATGPWPPYSFTRLELAVSG